MRQIRRQIAQFIRANHMVFDAGTAFHRNFAAQPGQFLGRFREHQPAFGANAASLTGVARNLSPQGDGTWPKWQGGYRWASGAKRLSLVTEIIRQKLHMQAARIGGAGGKAGFATFRHQHIHALPRQIKRGGKADHTTTNHQHIALPRDLRRGGGAGFPGDGRG